MHQHKFLRFNNAINYFLAFRPKESAVDQSNINVSEIVRIDPECIDI